MDNKSKHMDSSWARSRTFRSNKHMASLNNKRTDSLNSLMEEILNPTFRSSKHMASLNHKRTDSSRVRNPTFRSNPWLPHETNIKRKFLY
jgi:hypothetical protein